MNPPMQLKKALPLFLVTLTCFGSIPGAQAVSPAPGGHYPNANTALGKDALFSLTTGRENTAIGFDALYYNLTGSTNTAVGWAALSNNRDGNFNTAIGGAALSANTNGTSNTAIGDNAMGDNDTGNNNTSAGESALKTNQNGSNNTAIGVQALYNNEFSNNTATGSFALFANHFGSNNTANGGYALYFNNASNNTATGQNALKNNTSGSNNIGIGYNAGQNLTTGPNNIDIGNVGEAEEANTIRIGTQGTQTKTFIAGISGAAIGGMEVRVNQNGRLGTVPSSKRFKEAIKPMDKTSDVLLALRPVTFHYKTEIDPEGIPQFGLVAEEVEKVNPDLVLRDKEGKPYSVRYDAVNAMLLNEFLKEHKKVDQQESKIEKQGATIARQQKQIEALTAGLQKVSTQLEMSKPSPQTALNNQLKK
jgi:Chaperone of endosialidase